MPPEQAPPPPPYPPYPYYPQDEDELSLIDLWNIVWKRKWPWLVLGPLFAILGALYALKQPEIFRAEATLTPNVEQRGPRGLSALAGQFGGLASMAGLNLGGVADSTETALATLKSRQFLETFLAEKDAAKLLFPEEWDEATKSWLVPKKRRGTDNAPTAEEVYTAFTQDSLSIAEDKKTGIVTLAIELRDPAVAAAWANDLIKRLNAHLRSQARTEAERNLAFLQDQLKETPFVEIREALYALIESQTQTAMLANAKDDYAFKVLDPAYVPETRSRPKRALIVLASGMLGGFAGLFLCFVLHFVQTNKKKPTP